VHSRRVTVARARPGGLEVAAEALDVGAPDREQLHSAGVWHQVAHRSGERRSQLAEQVDGP
jgi:hypothetical protein